MPHNTLDVTSYNFTQNDELLLDTNVWLFVYGPQKPRNPKVETYSQALAKILDAQCSIYIDVLIVSEFINAYARLKWQLVAPHIKVFKVFRKSEEFKAVAQDIAADVRRVLKHCSRVENGFETSEIEGLMTEYAAGEYDFNDQIIVELCQRKGFKLVTDDGDFAGQEISIVTANRQLLR